LRIAPFVRPGELHMAEWTEFNLGDAKWRIPAERMKARSDSAWISNYGEHQLATQLESGAPVSVEPHRTKVRVLPL
jgi:hypothetical protein